MSLELVDSAKAFAGEQRVYQHHSQRCACSMRFAIFLPESVLQERGPAPCLFWLSGLTCTEQNFINKAGAQRAANALGMIIVAPDTSPRGDGVADADSYDFGQGAGFYCDASQQPWAKHYQMYSYVADELYQLVLDNFAVDKDRVGIFGHSMGGHGALTIHLKHPERFRSVSAFAPIVAPSRVPWGEKALTGYLGEERQAWRAYDASELVVTQPSSASILIDQGEADNFLSEQLRPELFSDACKQSGQTLQLRMQPGYDHSYYFIASFIDDHLQHHADALG